MVSLLSKTSRPVFDLKGSDSTDYTFVLENLNGGLVLSQVATSLLTGKNSGANDDNDEEEKKIDSNSGKDIEISEANLQKLNMDILKAISDSKENKPLDFYKVSPEISKVAKGNNTSAFINILENIFDPLYGLEDSGEHGMNILKFSLSKYFCK